MKFLFLDIETDVKAKVKGIHYKPEILSESITNDGGLFVQDILDAPSQEFGKIAVHYVNPQTGEQWYEYEDRPLTQEEEIQVLKDENLKHKGTNAKLLLALAREGIQV